MAAVVIDSNLLLLLVVGSANVGYIGVHKNLSQFDEVDFATLGQAITLYPEIVLLPHLVAEVSSLARQIRNPARARIQVKLAELVESVGEVYVPSLAGVARPEFDALGATDAVVLHACAPGQIGIDLALLTADNDLAVQAEILGYEVLNFAHLR